MVTLSSATAASPTFTAPSSADDLTFRVTVMDGRGGSDRDTVVITVTGNRSPTISSDPGFSLGENTTAVGTVIADDPDSSDSITGYSLSGTDAGLFAITSGGVLRFSAAPDFEDPAGGASDDSNSYELTVTATGGTGARALTATQDLTVTVTDVNEAPAFTSTDFSLAENTTAVGTVVATDPDADDSVTGYSLSGTDASLFAITSGGVLTFSTAPDFEDPAGGASDDANSYVLTVTATGGTGARALTAMQNLTVTVTDANEAPAITSDPMFSLAENTTAVGAVVAADPDADDSITRYSLSGTDAGLFAITGAGVLTFSTAPDFEDPAGGASDDSNTYTLTVTATGGAGARALTAAQDLTVTVTDVDEPLTATIRSAPATHDGATTFTFELHFSEAVAIGYEALRDDVFDVTDGTIDNASRLVSGSNQGWTITVDPDGHADVTVVLPVTTDCAATGAVCTSGGKMLSARVAVTVTDVNDPPTITSPNTFSLAENTTSVGTVVASDPDVADSVTGYSLSGTDASLFAITGGGVLSFSSAPNFENPQGGSNDDSNSYTLTVTATSGTGARALTDTQNFTVTVTNANEAPRITSGPNFSLAENTTAVGTVTATDPDAADSVTGYSLSGTDASLFAITSAGVLSFSSAPNFESPHGGANDNSNIYTLTVTATGGTGARARTGTQNLSVSVTDVNEAPTITSRTFSLAENRTSVGTVAASDPDSADSITGFSLSGTDAGLFQIASGGALSFRSAPNFENPQGGTSNNSNTYRLTVAATGGTGGRALTTSQALTVNVTDANDPPTITSDDTFSLAENTTAVGTVTASESDAADSITGYALSGTDSSLFEITAAGVLTFSSAPDFEDPEGGAEDDSNTYSLIVIATSGSGNRVLTGTQNLTVNVTNVNVPAAPANFRAQANIQATYTTYYPAWTPPDDGGSPLIEYRMSANSRNEQNQATGSGRGDWTFDAPASNHTFEGIDGEPGQTRVGPWHHWHVTLRARNSEGWGPAATFDTTLRLSDLHSPP